MSYQSPTLSQLIQQGEQQFAHRFPQLKRNSVITVLNRVCAALSAGEHIHLDYLAKQIIPTTADEEYLVEYALYKGIARKMAMQATGVISIDTVMQVEIPAGTVFQHTATGLNFVVQENQIVAAGKSDISVQCESEGEQGNLAAHSELTLSSAILGVKPAAVVKSMAGGSDIEPLSRLLSRLIQRVQYPPAGGAPHDYVRWATEVAGVTRAWCYPRWKGGGSVGVAFVCDDRENIYPTHDDIERVKNYIQGHRNSVTGQYEGMPANVELDVFSPRLQKVNFTLRISPDSLTLRQAVKQSLAAYLTNADSGALLYLSQIRATVSNTVGEVDNTVVFPREDIQLPVGTVAILGEIKWQ